MKETYDLIIIGGGAGGLAAGVTASKRGKRVLLIEKEDKLGKKILVTGNGKCNLSHVGVTAANYNSDFARAALDVDVVGFFHRLGLATKIQEGRVYPYSESALSVLNVLRKNFDGEVVLGQKVNKIERKDDIFVVNGRKGKAVLLATGSRATKGEDSAYLYEAFGHTCTPKRAAIVPLVTDPEYVRPLANLRVKGVLTLLRDGKEGERERGEILFKQNGVSGIAAMMLSTHVARDPDHRYDLSLDLVPDETADDVKAFVRIAGAESYLQKAVAQSVEKQSKCRGVSVADCLRDYRIERVKPGDFANAQVVCGGLRTEEFDENFMSKKVKDLYACGEVLDVDGECGGFNLHFAFASGIKVGEIC